MLRKRAAIYFLVIAFPMGLGAGASTWLKISPIKLPALTIVPPTQNEAEEPQQKKSPRTSTAADLSAEHEEEIRLPDFGVMHPLVVGSFSLLLCTGILLAADKPRVA